ncbi:MAG TPA: hypothetical protein VKU38_11355, partial [Ktedonobacteraceae bacterium]|nr:hypothetical protein [Ktedonobacteraceae bacterium]
NYWNIIGLYSRVENELLVDIQFIYVDDDTLSWEDFNPLRDVSSSLSIGPAELVALIQFLEEIAGHTLLNEESTLQHFHFLNADDLANLKFTQLEIDIHEEDCYRYFLDKDMSNADSVNLFSLPQWIRRGKIMRGTMLNFVTFEQQRLASPKFRPLQIRGLTTATFNQRALEEFILLLKQRTYEAALQAFHS